MDFFDALSAVKIQEGIAPAPDSLAFDFYPRLFERLMRAIGMP